MLRSLMTHSYVPSTLGNLLMRMSFANRAHDRRFEENTSDHLFRGVFDTAEQALLSRPKGRPVGYDNVESAALYFSRMRHETYDYPAMFWIEKSIQAGMQTVFDVGGHIGIKFYAFAGPLNFPPSLRWTVCDVPAVARRGEAVAKARGAGPQLAFTTDYGALEGTDLLFASGALQYLPMSLWEWLAGTARPPRRIIINTTPVHASRDFFTLNSIGTAYCPYRVFSEGTLLTKVQAAGYAVTDRWINDGKALLIPGHAEFNLTHYSGYCFDRIGS